MKMEKLLMLLLLFLVNDVYSQFDTDTLSDKYYPIDNIYHNSIDTTIIDNDNHQQSHFLSVK